jgi:hypothetical protein
MWVNKVPWSESTDPDFEQFYTCESGVRAGLKNIATLIKDGANTPETLLNEYAPASDNNDPESYAKDVANAIGIDVSDSIDLSNRNTVFAMAKGFIERENGAAASWVTDDIINEGINETEFFFSAIIKQKTIMEFLKKWYNWVAIILITFGGLITFFPQILRKLSRNFKTQKYIKWTAYALIPFGVVFFFYEYIVEFIETKITK